MQVQGSLRRVGEFLVVNNVSHGKQIAKVTAPYSHSMPRPEEVHRPPKDRSPGNQLAKFKTTYKYP
jgi:hypothetical protein